MRKTVTLDPDAEAAIKQLMQERGLTFKQAVNEAIRAGTQTLPRRPFETPTFTMGRPLVDLTKALRLAAELEDEEIIRKLASGR